MAARNLTQHDISILEKIKDPEAGPSAPLMIDASLPRDPHVTDPVLYQSITKRERDIISCMQSVEMQIAGVNSVLEDQSPLQQYLEAVERFNELIEEHPNYASARNNRAQALRRIYGDGLLVETVTGLETPEAEVPPLDLDASDAVLIATSKTILNDLTTAINLLTRPTPFVPLSPQSAKTLSQAYTQRGAVYHLTAKYLSSKGAELRIDGSRKEAEWKTVDFEENASRDFMLGGRYGNEIAKALAVAANPTAKLCGEMVKEAMRKEYAGGMAK